jgi:hypothetical protein
MIEFFISGKSGSACFPQVAICGYENKALRTIMLLIVLLTFAP